MPLPTPGGSKDKWGKMLNYFLTRSHTEDGDLLPEVVADIRQGLADSADVTALQDQVGVTLNPDGTPRTGEIGDAYVWPESEATAEKAKIAKVAPSATGLTGEKPSTGPSGPVWSRGWFNVKDAGIKGDGSTEEMAAINSVIATAYTAGFRYFYFPAGTYIVKPTTTTGIEPYSDATFGGDGYASCIKVIDNAGDYSSVIRPATSSKSVANFTVENLRIDQNAANQLTTTNDPIAGGITRLQFAVYGQYFRGTTVRRVYFDTCTGVNTIFLGTNDSLAHGDHRVEKCVFVFRKLPNAANASANSYAYDNSALYLIGGRAFVTDNIFLSEPTEGARGCCEFHGPHMVFERNISDGYQTLINIGWNTTAGSDALDWTVRNNVGKRLGIGIRLMHKDVLPTQRVFVTDNDLHFDTAAHNSNQAFGLSFIAGSGSLGTARTIHVMRNVFDFEPDTRTTSLSGATIANPTYNSGIVIGVAGVIQDLRVEDNTILNPPGYGMVLGESGCTLRDATVKGNRIVSPTHMSHGNFTQRVWVQLIGTLDNFDMVNNEFIDDRAIGAQTRRWLWTGSGGLTAATEAWVYDNELILRGAAAGETWSTSFIDWTRLSRKFVKATINPASIAAGAQSTHTVTMTGATTADTVTAVPAGGIEAGLSFFAYVSAANTITLVITNHTSGGVDPASRVWRFRLQRTEQDA